jgi:hypothetical protein
MDFQDVGYGGVGGMDWIDLAQDCNMTGACECSYAPSGTIICVEFLD